MQIHIFDHFRMLTGLPVAVVVEMQEDVVGWTNFGMSE